MRTLVALACWLWLGLAPAQVAVTRSDLNLRSGPGTNFASKQVLEAGRTVYILDTVTYTPNYDPDWVQVLVGDAWGYLRFEYLRRVDERAVQLSAWGNETHLPQTPMRIPFGSPPPLARYLVRIAELNPEYLIRREAVTLQLGTVQRFEAMVNRSQNPTLAWLELPPLPEGSYYLSLADPNASTAVLGAMVLQVSGLGVMAKTTPGFTQYRAVDASSGKPLAGVRIQTWQQPNTNDRYPTLQNLGEVVTDSQGMAQQKTPRDSVQYFMAQHGSSTAFSPFGMYGMPGEPYRALVISDRPLYQPKDHIRLNGVVRQQVGPELKPYAGTAQLRLRRGDYGPVVLEQNLTLGSLGQFELSLQPQLAPGNYQAELWVEGEPISAGKAVFAVQVYQKPAFDLSVSGPSEAVSGASSTFKLQASYPTGGNFSGKADVFAEGYPIGSVGNDFYEGGSSRQLEISLSRDDPPNAENLSGGLFFYPEPESRMAQSSLQDGQGNLALRLAAKEQQITQYTVQLLVRDAFNRQVPHSHQVTIYPGGIALSNHTQGQPQAGQPLDITIEARRVGTQDKLAGRTIQLEVRRVTYEYTPDFRERILQLNSLSLTTNANGQSTYRYTPEGPGLIVLQASARDSNGRVTPLRQELGYIRDPSPPLSSSLEWVVEQRVLEVGQTLSLKLNSRLPNGTPLWISLEGREIYQQKVLASSNEMVLEWPITQQLQGGFWLEAMAIVNGKGYQASSGRIFVPPVGQRLELEVKPVSAQYSPGDTASFTVQTRLNGQPVSAWVSIGAVNQALYALQKDTVPDPWRYFWGMPYLGIVQSYSSHNPNFADGLGGGGPDTGLYLRQNFDDTAFFIGLQTDPNGQAHFSARLPDDLARYQLLARAVTPETAVAESQAQFSTYLPIYLRFLGPSFLTSTDQATGFLSVHNATQQTKKVEVSWQIDNRKQTQLVEVRANSATLIPIAWQAPNSESWVLNAQAQAGNLGDKLQVSLPVHPRGEAVSLTQLSEGSGNLRDIFTVPAESSAAKLKVQLAPSSLSLALAHIDGLLYYDPQSPLEALLCALRVAGSQESLGLPNQRAIQMVWANLAALGDLQNPDGGLAWRKGGPSSFSSSLEGLLALSEAQTQGYQSLVDEPALLEYLGRAPEGLAQRMALFRLGRISATELSQSASRLRPSLAQTAQLGLLLPSEATAYWARLGLRADSAGLSVNQDLRASAYALGLALLLNRPESTDIARWLASRLQSGSYRSPSDSALASLYLSRWAKAQGLAAGQAVSLRLNGRTLRNLSSLPALGVSLEAALEGRTQTLELQSATNVAMLRTLEYYTANPQTPSNPQWSIERSYSQNEVGLHQTLEVRLKIRLSQAQPFVQIEDPIAAGFEPLWGIPSNNAVVLQGAQNLWVDASWLSDRAVFWLQEVPAGELVLSYRLRSLASGVYWASAPSVYVDQNPQNKAWGLAQALRVRN